MISAVYMLRGYRAVFHGRNPGPLDRSQGHHHRFAGRSSCFSPSCSLAGFFPQIFVNLLKPVRRRNSCHQIDDRARLSRNRRPGHRHLSATYYESFAEDREKSFVAAMGIAGLGLVFIASFFAVQTPAFTPAPAGSSSTTPMRWRSSSSASRF